MKKLIILAVALLALGVAAGVVAIRATDHSSSALAAAQGQEDILSSSSSPQDSTPDEQKPWLGATVVRTPDGLTISSVIADSPADKAGLKRGDVIKAVDGTAVSDMAALLNALKDKKPGDTVTFSITRDGAAQDITVTVEARPEALPGYYPVFPELNGIPRDQLFSHMLGGSFQFTDKDNQTHTVTLDLGTVTAVDTSAKTITVQLNSGGDPQTYTITDDVLTAPEDLAQFESGDKVIVISVDGSLRAVSKGPGCPLPFFGKGSGHRGGMRGFGGPGFGTPGEQGLEMPGLQRGLGSGNPGGM